MIGNLKLNLGKTDKSLFNVHDVLNFGSMWPLAFYGNIGTYAILDAWPSVQHTNQHNYLDNPLQNKLRIHWGHVLHVLKRCDL